MIKVTGTITTNTPLSLNPEPASFNSEFTRQEDGTVEMRLASDIGHSLQELHFILTQDEFTQWISEVERNTADWRSEK